MEEARGRASAFQSPQAKQSMEDIAAGYDAMAERAEKQEQGDTSN